MDTAGVEMGVKLVFNLHIMQGYKGNLLSCHLLLIQIYGAR